MQAQRCPYKFLVCHWKSTCMMTVLDFILSDHCNHCMVISDLRDPSREVCNSDCANVKPIVKNSNLLVEKIVRSPACA